MTRAALAAAGFVRKEIDGTVYFEGGSGNTIVLVHGVNDQAGSWFTVAPKLAQTHRVILPDLAGHGESAPKEGPLPISLMVERLHSVIPEERVILVGNSLGGWLAMLYTLAHSERVARLILEAAGGLSLPLESPVVATNREEAIAILRNVHGPNFQPPEWIIEALLERGASSPMLRVTEAMEHVLDPRLPDIKVPTSIVWGADDGVVTRKYVETLQRGIENSTLHVIEGAAHIPHMQQPERFLACLSSIF
jgi:pimeloyl-ACP methyl ester carboxylesterase